MQTVTRTKALEDWWMRRRVHYATREELRGFVCHPMHPRMVELATEEIRRRDQEEGGQDAFVDM